MFGPRHAPTNNGKNLKNPDSEYFRNITTAIQVFMDEMIVKMTEYGIKDPKPQVRGVILAGEASREGMESFKEIAKVSLPEYEVRFMFHIDPLIIGAVGAAHRARQRMGFEECLSEPRAPVHDDLTH